MPLEKFSLLSIKERPTVDEDGFKMVSYKQKKRYKHRKTNKNLKLQPLAEPDIEVLDKEMLQTLLIDLEKSTFFSEFMENLNDVIADQFISVKQDESVSKGIPEMPMNDMDIVCYGLGHLFYRRLSLAPRYQLCLLLLLRRELKPQNVFIYDPVFLPEEITFLKELGLSVLDINEHGKRTAVQNTLFFMPHCDYDLYNNLLSANWREDNLVKVIIVGNRLQGYLYTLCSEHLKETAQYLFHSSDIVTQVDICNNFKLCDPFNNFAVLYFSLKDLQSFKKWNIGDESAEKTI